MKIEFTAPHASGLPPTHPPSSCTCLPLQDLKGLTSEQLDYQPFNFVDKHRSRESEIVKVRADMLPLVKETMTKFKSEKVSWYHLIKEEGIEAGQVHWTLAPLPPPTPSALSQKLYVVVLHELSVKHYCFSLT